MAETDAASGIGALDERGLDALIEHVEETIEHHLALPGADLSLLPEALVTLTAVTERPEHHAI